MKIIVFFLLIWGSAAGVVEATEATPSAQPFVWPSPPDQARIEYVREIKCDDLKPKSGFFGKIFRIIGGSDKSEELSLPFDLALAQNKLYMVCQNIPALVEINLDNQKFKLYQSREKEMQYPVSLCHAGRGIILVTDSEGGIVYRLEDGKLKPFISSPLVRPTGIVALPDKGLIYIVDTGDHSLKMFDLSGKWLKTINAASDSLAGFHFPTFASTFGENEILINDALNYQIKRFDSEGHLIFSFGHEGDGPGTFARSKGIGTDSDGNIYVVDNLFDNFQIFDAKGRLLLVVGSTGRELGQFWSPAGIEIANDTIYIADTFNNRIQVFRYLGAGSEK